jgi:hypothetical protein
LHERFPELAPYILLKALPLQADTNSQVVAAFRESLEKCAQDPSKVAQPKSYFEQLMWGPPRWALNSHQYDLVNRIATAHERAAAVGIVPGMSSAEKVIVIYASMAQEQWREALSLIETLGDQAVNVSNLGEGPWGSPFQPVLPGRLAQECRAHLGAASTASNVEFELGRPLKSFTAPFAFLPDGERVWIAESDSLLCLGSAGETLQEVSTPNAPDVDVSCMCATPGRIWIGTKGEGLIEYTLATGKCRQFRLADGLLLNNIACLLPQKDVLWIGFGRQDGVSWQGGIGKLELTTHRAAALTPPLNLNAALSARPGASKDSRTGPPVGLVVAIAEGQPGELWLAVRDKGVQRYLIDKESWETFPSSDSQNLLSCLAANREQVFAGCYDPSFDGERSTRGGLIVHPFDGTSWQTFRVAQGLPANQITAMALDGQALWIGGFGFIAAFDAHEQKIVKRCYVPAQSVDSLQITGGTLWARISDSLYRVPIWKGPRNHDSTISR